MRVDLHLHTWISDGEVSPTELVERAVAARLDVIAVTDHDTAAGIPEAMLAAVGKPLVLIPGIEVSCRVEETELHILGYWIDPLSPAILEHQRLAGSRRTDRMLAMIERLRGMGIEVSIEEVQAAAGPSVKSLGRPHLARALHAARHTRFYGEAFTRFIGNSGPAYVAEGFPSPEYAIKVIHEAGGRAVWAHPPLDCFDRLLPGLRDMGLDGVECFRPAVDRDDSLHLESAALELGMFATGGSDWHGPSRGRLGEFAVAGGRVEPFLSIGNILG
ncbi:MAG: PHP domain-containing protein [Gemmatimonadota bacterium]|jgi:predicted metal-dependent phosphoesterase TrpH|nr:PHP domain-containing protein [Gemmatimonadota bacterium]